jgi:hypothetical protein
LLGRRTFDAFRTFKPNQPRDPTSLADYLNRVPIYVLASTLEEPQCDQPRSSAATPSRTSLA